MARLFVPPSFTASSVPEVLYTFLRGLADDCLVLFDFYTRGEGKRHVEVAILAPYGVELLSVMNGKLEPFETGAWRGEDGSPLPLSAAGENPYDEALNNATLFEHWLRDELKRPEMRVYPLLFSPLGEPPPPRGFVTTHGGLKGLSSSLRALKSLSGSSRLLSERHYGRIIAALGLFEVRLTLVRGRVLDNGTGTPLANVALSIGSATQKTDADGNFSFVTRVGEHEIMLNPPPPYVPQSLHETFRQGGGETLKLLLTPLPTPEPVAGESAPPEEPDKGERLEQRLTELKRGLAAEARERAAIVGRLSPVTDRAELERAVELLERQRQELQRLQATLPAELSGWTLARPSAAALSLPRSSKTRRRLVFIGLTLALLLSLVFLLQDTRNRSPQTAAETVPATWMAVATPLERPDDATPALRFTLNGGVLPQAGFCPVSHPVKGSQNRWGERLYLEPQTSYYGLSLPEVCFRDARSAERAGFRAEGR